MALLASLALMVSSLAGIASGQTVDCSKPTIRHITINQGTDEYAQGSLPGSTTSRLTKALAWGKDTIVRPHLTLTCTTGSPTTQTTQAQLAVTHVETAAPIVSGLTPFAPVASPFGSVTACCAPAPDNAADPRFLLPGSLLSVEPPTAPALLRFSVTVNYVTSTGLTGQVSAEKTAVVGKKANSLRVLVVPMGDKHNVQNKTTPQWGSSDTQSLQSAFAAFQRMAPVANGLETLSAAANAGMFWQLAPTTLDLGKGVAVEPGLDVLRSDGMFCGSSANFDKIKTKLINDYYNTWNAANPARVVDVVVGVVSANTSLGNASGCNDGQAAAPGTASWARITPTAGGPVLAMEIGHNLAVVPTDADGDGQFDSRHAGWHSTNTEAETLGRAYNLLSRNVITSDRTVMRAQSSSTNDNTLFEPPDWAWAQCKLGAFKPYPGACGASAGFTGTPASAEDPPEVFQIRGTIHETTGAADLRSNVTSGGPVTAEEDSGYFLTYVTSGGQPVTAPDGTPRKFKLPVSFGSSDHHSAPDSDAGVVEGRFPFYPSDSAATRSVQVWKGEPPPSGLNCTGNCLYEAPLTRRPQVTRIEITPTRWAFEARPEAALAGIAEGEPNLSFERNYLTYIAPNQDGCWSIFVLDLTTGSKAHRCSLLGGQPVTTKDQAARFPAMSPDNTSIAFSQAGDLLRVEFDAVAMKFGTTTKLYQCVRGASGACVTGFNGTPLQAAACCPAWSPTLARPADVPITCGSVPRGRQWLAFEVGGDIYRMFPFCDVELTAGGERSASKPQLLTQDNLGVETATFETQPTISDCDRDAADPRTCSSAAGAQPQAIAYERSASATGPKTLWTLNLTNPQNSQRALKTSAGEDILGNNPSWGGELVAYQKAGEVFFVNPDNPQPELVTSDGGSPSLVPGLDDRTMAIVRSDDIYIGTVGTGRDITMIGSDDTASIKRTTGLLLLHCAGADVPLGGLAPQRVDGETVAYTLHNYDMALACRDAPVVGFISDTFLLSSRFGGPSLDAPGTSPVAQFVSPSAGSVVAANAPISLEADAWGADDTALEESQLQLSLQLPGTTTFVGVGGTGGTKDVLPAQFGRAFWPSGEYRARVQATDTDGNTVEAFTSFRIDRSRSILDFEPNTLYVPSSGNPVTVKLVGLTTAEVAAAKVARITEVGGFEVPSCVTTSSGCVALEAPIKSGEAKFDREALTTFMKEKNLVGSYVAVIVDGCSSVTAQGRWACGPLGDVFSGVDPAAPIAKPVS